MRKRSGSETRKLDRTTTIRWDEDSLAQVTELAEANGRSVGKVIRWLVARAHRNLPRTRELSAELIQARIALNALIKTTNWNAESVARLKELIAQIERLLRDLR